MDNHRTASVIIGDAEYCLLYDDDGTGTRALLQKAWELDVLAENIEPSGVNGLQLLAQMQLLDESQLKSMVDDVAAIFEFLPPFSDEFFTRHQYALGKWQYGIKRQDFKRTQEAIADIVSIIEELRPYYLDKINDMYPGERYRQRFYTALLAKLTSK